MEQKLKELEAKNEELRSWIKAANQFAWAHDKGCPRGESAGECTCGLDQFLGRPRPLIESYKDEIYTLQRTIAVMQMSHYPPDDEYIAMRTAKRKKAAKKQ